MKRGKKAPDLRTLEPADAQRLVQMDEQFTGSHRRAWYEEKLQHEVGDIRVSLGAEVDGLLVGAVLGSLRDGEFGVSEPIAVLDTILVDRAYQGRGIATAMLEQLARNLRAFGIERLRTEVGWDERLLNGFLSSTGFVPAPRVVLELDLKTDRQAAGRPADNEQRPS